MIKTILIDENAQSCELIKNYLSQIENIEILFCENEFDLNNEKIKEAELIIFDINSKNFSETLEKIRQIKKEKEQTKFIATSYEINSELVNKTLKEGIDDFLLKPIILSILEASIKKINTVKIKKAKTISVFSSKGGVGKTSLAMNLGWEIFKHTNEKVCILDLSFSDENIVQYFNLENKFDINYIFDNLEKSNKELLLSLFPRYKDSDLYVIQGYNNFSFERKFGSEKIIKIINALKNVFDFIIIDLASIATELNASVFMNCDIVLLISLLNKQTLINLPKSYELFDKIGYNDDKIKLIINRYIENQEIEKECGIKNKLFAKIPNNYLTLIDAINQGKPASEIHPHSNIAKAYQKLAQRVLELDFENLNNTNNINHGIFNLLRRMGD